jgi:tetratricopeptide (TPR) repeat protein
MRLRARVALIRGAFWPLVIGCMAVVATTGSALELSPLSLVGLTSATAAAITLTWRSLFRWWNVRALRRHREAFELARDADDESAFRRWYEEIEEYVRFFRLPEESLQSARCYVLLNEERWAEARAALAALNRDKFTDATRVLHANAMAWCLAHDGAAAEAVSLAESACASEAAARPADRPYLHGTRGVALTLDGRYADALAPLQKALAAGGPAWAQAVRSYYLGQALFALARVDEARAAWERAAAESSQSRWARRAQQRLATAVPSAYR